MAALEFARPGALALLILPVLVLWLARRAASRPRVDATGTLEIWRRSAPMSPRSRERLRIPLAVWFVALALGFGTLALAAPEASEVRAPRTLLVVVDRSPSMYLADGAGTRLDHALRLLEERLAVIRPDRVAWIAPPIEADESRAPTSMPGEWRAPPRWSVSEPDFAAFDREGAMFVTDRACEPPPRFAGACSSGGAAVPGPIGESGGSIALFDGTRIVLSGVAERRRVVIGADVPEPIARIAAVWAGARGFDVSNLAEGDDPALEIESWTGTRPSSCNVARDGWSALGRMTGALDAEDERGPLVPWLTTSTGEAVVASGNGRIRSSLVEIEEPHGDPAAWAVSWSRLFDESLALRRGSVSLEERAAAGAPVTRDPSGVGARAVDPKGPWTALVAALATLCALVGAGLGLWSRRGPRQAVP